MTIRAEASSIRASVVWSWARLGDPAARSLTVALLYLPISLAGPVLIDLDRLGGSVEAWLAVGLAGELAVLAVFASAGIAARTLAFDHPGPGLTGGVLLLAVALRSVVIAWLPAAMGLTAVPEWGYRLGAGIVTQFGLLVVLALIVSAYAYHRRLAGQLAHRRAELIAVRRSVNERLTQMRRQLADEVHRVVDPLISALDRSLEQAQRDGDASEARAVVRDIVEGTLRPLSHRLTDPNPISLDPVSVSAPRPSRPPLPSRMPASRLVQPLSVGLLVALMAGSQGIRELPFGQAVIFTFATGVGVAVILAVVRAFVGRLSLPTWLGVVMAILVSSIALVSTLLVLRSINWPVPEHIRLAAVVMGGVVGGMVAFYAVVTARREATEDELRSSVEGLQATLSELRQHEFVTRRELGLILHGTVQSALHAAVMRLAAHPAPDTALLSEIRRDISAATARLDAPQGSDALLVDTLADIAELWDGTCTVRWTLDHQTLRLLVESPAAAASVAEITRECVANAIRHGQATEVWITIARSGDRVVVTSLDNGPASTDWSPGMGTRLLDELTMWWTHETADPGTRVQAVVVVSRSRE